MEEFFDFFEVDKDKLEKDKSFTIDLEDSDSFIDAISVVQENDLFNLDEQSLIYDETVNKLMFYTKDYTVTFNGNFDTDSYIMSIKKEG